MFIIIITIVTQGPRMPPDVRGPLKGSIFVNTGILQAIGVISFGKRVFVHRMTRTMLTCHSFRLSCVVLGHSMFKNCTDVFKDHNSLLIYGSLKKPTLDRFAWVTHYSTFISMIACMTVALAGFLTFGDKTLGNLLVSSCKPLRERICPNSHQNNFPTNNLMVNVARL